MACTRQAGLLAGATVIVATEVGMYRNCTSSDSVLRGHYRICGCDATTLWTRRPFVTSVVTGV